MRTFETIMAVAVALAVFLPVLIGARLKRGRIAALLVVAFGMQVVVEGFRYQLLPLYLATLGLAAGDVLWEERRLRGYPRFRRAALGVVGVAAVVALPLALPVPELAEPSGPHAVGTTTVVLVDRERQDPYGAQALAERAAGEDSGVADDDVVTDPRRLPVQVWYPAEPDPDAPRVQWAPEEAGPALSRRFGFPGFFLSHTNDLRAHAREGLEPLSGRFPVVVYAHGWAGSRTIAVDQMEELASHGYLVVAADHTHAAVVTVFPDDQVVSLEESALPDEEEVGPEEYAEARELLVETFAEDMVSILDGLAEGDEGVFGQLASHADLGLVGLFGHSTGGGAALWACIVDDRCDAAVGFDPWVEPLPNEVLAEDLAAPSLLVRSDGWRDTPNDRLLRGLAERSSWDAWWMGIEGASHNDFVLPPRFSPVAHRLGVKGPISSERVDWILDTYLVGFFDHYLYGLGGAVLERPPPEHVDLELTP